MATNTAGANKKYILEEILEQYFPRNSFDHPELGFTFSPWLRWFRENLRDYMMDNLTCQNFKEILKIYGKRVSNLACYSWKATKQLQDDMAATGVKQLG